MRIFFGFLAAFAREKGGALKAGFFLYQLIKKKCSNWPSDHLVGCSRLKGPCSSAFHIADHLHSGEVQTLELALSLTDRFALQSSSGQRPWTHSWLLYWVKPVKLLPSHPFAVLQLSTIFHFSQLQSPVILRRAIGRQSNSSPRKAINHCTLICP